MWDKPRDKRLFKLKAQGYSFAEIGEMIGVSRNAAIGRFSRLSGKQFPSQVLRRKEARQAALSRRADAAKQRQRMMADIKTRLSRTGDRLAVIESALKDGATYQIIGDALGVSKQYIHQLRS